MLNSGFARSLSRTFGTAVISTALLAVTPGCHQLPGTSGEQGAAIGGVGGAATGALIGGEHHRLLGALLGVAVGAGGGYLIGANKDRITGHDTAGAEEAVRRAQAHPATPQEALSAPTADLNGDGFVTMDEVVAMKRAGFSDPQMLDKMRATGQVFELTADQQNYLRSNGVDDYVIGQIPELNRDVRNALSGQPGGPAQPGSVPVYTPGQPNPNGAPVYPPSSSQAPVYPPSSGQAPVYPSAPPSANTPVPPPPGP